MGRNGRVISQLPAPPSVSSGRGEAQRSYELP
ncbi:hypothetical protein E2C01_060568 [Portunus trituberculatus]|uniref:Uncharacterized protein n=1 Tax=Portunus trituberculatus TaxID=210409 RepID=A0A5B7H1I9_PORTR|nr:hypothetical protein [Portunus trituberculatus]